ncbi:helix-turn-helix domain-containing protein [Rhizobium puerariae]|uniref:Helix-turn-helix domain-containing protein n=1 Tax=Rhizobium puerariae TaxID=1585791 RepID=A0ABV6AS26_9HYPH
MTQLAPRYDDLYRIGLAALAVDDDDVEEAAAELSEEWDLRDLPAAMEALYEARRASGLRVYELEDRSGVSFNAGHAWLNGHRSAHLSCFVAVAQTLGFETLLRKKDNPAVCFDLSRTAEVMQALNKAREESGMFTTELRERSGVSMSSFYSWLRRYRDPTIGKLVFVADALGFDVIMRRKLK